MKVGVYHTPKQFLSLAKELKHPIDATDHLEPATRQALQFNLRYPAEVVKLERKKNLLFARLLAAQTEPKKKPCMMGYLWFGNSCCVSTSMTTWRWCVL